MGRFNPSEYIEVADRIPLFWQEHPDGGIVTEIVRIEGAEVIVMATLYRSKGDVLATGIAREVEGKSPVNRTSHVENAETSAIGRALANAGFTGSAKRASRQEMEKVQRQQADHDELLRYISAEGKKVADEVTLDVGDKQVPLKEYVRKNWNAIKERHALARHVADAIEGALTVSELAEVGNG